MSHHIAMTVGMKENLLDVGVQSYLKKLIHTVVQRQECFQLFKSYGPYATTGRIWLANQSQIENES